MRFMYKSLSLYVILTLLLGCSTTSTLNKSDLIGNWVNNDTNLKLYEDGTFETKGLQKDVVAAFSLSCSESIINGKGKWSIQQGKGFLEVKLQFSEINGNLKSTGFYTLFISGSNKFENLPPWYLFVWQDEEGGERLKLLKK